MDTTTQRVLRFLDEMLVESRGYMKAKKQDDKAPPAESKMVIMYVKEDTSPIYAFIMNNERDGKGTNLAAIRNAIDYVNSKRRDDKENQHCILITPTTFNSEAGKKVDTIQPMVRVEMFTFPELLMNPTKHVLQPKISVLSDEDRLDLLDKYGLDPRDTHRIRATIPAWMKNGPITKWYDFQPDQIIMVKRTKHDTFYNIVL